MNGKSNWYKINNEAEIDTPALLVYPDRIRKNIRTAIHMIGDVQRLRPHVKTHKCAEAAAMMMEAGMYKFKCATIAEAEMLAMQHANDVLLAYQPVGPKLTRFIELIKKYRATDFSCLTDNIKTATEQSKVCSSAGLEIGLYIDLNVGMNRTGIAPGKEAFELYQCCSTLPGIQIKGLHVYDGHFRNPDFEAKKKEVDAAFHAVENLSAKIKAAGHPEPVIIAGGSPTFSVHCKRPAVECSPGTFIYWDHGYATICPEQDFVPAAILLTRVISLPANDHVCTDLGHKSVAAENELSKRVFFPEHSYLRPVAQSEEHLVLKNSSNGLLQPGDMVYGIPYHICPTVNLYDSVTVVEHGKAGQTWRTIARDRKITV